MENDKSPKSATEAAGYIAGVGIGMTRLLSRRTIALVLLNAGIFFLVAALLPRASNYEYSGFVSKIINSRLHWDIAWLATLASSCITTGAVIIFSGRKDR